MTYVAVKSIVPPPKVPEMVQIHGKTCIVAYSGAIECEASSHMIDMTMGYLLLTICDNIVDALLRFLSLTPRLGAPPS